MWIEYLTIYWLLLWSWYLLSCPPFCEEIMMRVDSPNFPQGNFPSWTRSYVARMRQHWNGHDTRMRGKFFKIHTTRASDTFRTRHGTTVGVFVLHRLEAIYDPLFRNFKYMRWACFTEGAYLLQNGNIRGNLVVALMNNFLSTNCDLGNLHITDVVEVAEIYAKHLKAEYVPFHWWGIWWSLLQRKS